jgi:hypothetical protein
MFLNKASVAEIKKNRLDFEDHRVAKKMLFMTYIRTLLGKGTERESDHKSLYNRETTSGVVTTKLPRECTGHLNFLVRSLDGDF